MGKGWTEAERAFLRKTWPTEKAEFIGSRLGRGKSSVIGQAHRLGLEHKGSGVPRKRVLTPRIVAPKPMPPPEPEPERLTGPVPLLQAKEYHCRAVVDERGPDGLAMFCGKPIVGFQSFSFCSDHLNLYTTRGYVHVRREPINK